MSRGISLMSLFVLQLGAAIVMTAIGLIFGTLLFFTPGAIKLIAAWLPTF